MKPSPHTDTISKVLLLVPPQVHLLDINGPAHIFYEAKEYGAPVDLYFVSINEQSVVQSSAGLTFSDLKPFSEFKLTEDDFILVPGMDYKLLTSSSFIQKSKPFFSWIIQQHARGAKICSSCTGAFLLAESGILNGHSCTTHWKYFTQFGQRYPHAELKKNRLFVVDKGIYTSAGVSSGIDLALYLLEEQFGAKLATDVAKEVVIYFRRSELDPQLSVFLQYRNHLDTRIHDAQDYIAQNLATSFNLEEISQRVNMSVRNLTRLFKKTAGVTIGTYIDMLRVDRAEHLLRDGNKMEYVANQCGLKSANQLRSILNKHHT